MTGILIVILVVVVGGWKLITKIAKKRAIERLRRLFPRPVFVENTHARVRGVCLATEFEERYMATIKTARLNPRESAKPVRVWVPRTFTFYSSNSQQRIMHVGHLKVLYSGMTELVSKITGGYDINIDFDKKEQQEIEKILFCRDGRLYVPFAGFEDFDQQIDMYKKVGPTDFYMMIDQIVSDNALQY